MNPTCCDCMYYQSCSNYGGDCRLKPPIPIYDGDGRKCPAAWPEVRSDDWCGQFKSAKSEAIDVDKDKDGNPVVNGTSEKE